MWLDIARERGWTRPASWTMIGGMGKRRSPPAPPAASARFDNPFAGLKSLRAALPEGNLPEGNLPEQELEKAVDDAQAQGSNTRPAGASRAIVRYQRKGRGGKEVTLVEGLALPTQTLEEWLQALKRSLGCGGTVEGDVLVFQGDQRKRVPALLEGRGVRRVVLG